MNIIDNQPKKEYMQLFPNEKMFNIVYTPKERRDINKRYNEINNK